VLVKIPGWPVVGLLVLLSLVVGGCASLEKGLDRSGLRDIDRRLAAESSTGRPAELEALVERFDPFGIPTTEASRFHHGALGRWNMKSSAFPDLREERLSFDSPLGDQAIFYLYHEGSLAGKRAILWVPGYGVSDFAFTFIRTFFRAELDEGYAILFYTIPYNLERTTRGRAAGEGLLSIDTAKNLLTFAGVVSELRSGVEYLRSQGISSVSGWGSSIGAAFLWTLSSRERFDHLALMIPVVDWNTLLFNPRLEAARKRLENLGYSQELLSRAYRDFSPIAVATLTEPGNIELLYGKLDQLTPEARSLEFAAGKGIVDIHAYEESHGSILLNSRIYEDYRLFLERVTP
jgi:hypothetical protein